MKELKEIFEQLQYFSSVFVDLSDETTSTSYEMNFSNFDSFSQTVNFSILQSPDFLSRVCNLCTALLLYEQRASSEEEIWDQLIKQEMSAKKLSVFAWYLMERGLKSESAVDEHFLCISAASVYMALCCLNGSQAFHIFNSFLFERGLDSMRLAYRLLALDGFRGIGSSAIARDARSKPRGSRAKIAARARKTHKETSNVEVSMMVELTNNDRRQVNELVLDATDSLFVMLKKVSLSSFVNSVTCTANLLSDFLYVDFDGNPIINKIHRLSEFQQLKKVSDRSFALMHRLIDDRNNGAEAVFSRILMPRILFYTQERTILPSGAHIPKLLFDYKNAVLKFMNVRIQECNRDELKGIFRLLQTVSYRCPDRTDYKNNVANVVMEILALLPFRYQYDFVRFLCAFSTLSRVSCRSFSIEITRKLLLHIEETPSQTIEDVEVKNGSGSGDSMATAIDGGSTVGKVSVVEENGPSSDRKDARNGDDDETNKCDLKSESKYILITIILRACLDKAPTIRSKAINQLPPLIANDSIRDEMFKMMELIANELKCDNFVTFEEKTYTALVDLIICRCSDARISSRKMALNTLEALFIHLSPEVLPFATVCFKDRCRDPSLLVRKQSAGSLSRLLILFGGENDFLDDVWLNAVLPMVVDPEQSVSQYACVLVTNIAINPLLEGKNALGWRLLQSIERKADYKRYLFRTVLQQSQDRVFTQKTVETLLNLSCTPDEKQIVWMLLKDLSFSYKVNGDVIIQAWSDFAAYQDGEIVVYIANVLARNAIHFTDKQKDELRNDISERLLNFMISEVHISAVYFALSQTFRTNDTDLSCNKDFNEFNKAFIDVAYRSLRNIIYRSLNPIRECIGPSQNSCSDDTIQQLIRMIVSIGEIVLYDASLINAEIFDTLQLIFASDVICHQLSQSIKLFSCQSITRSDQTKETRYTQSHETVCKPENFGTIKYSQNSYAPASQASQKLVQGVPNFTGGSLNDPTFSQHSSVNMEVLKPAVRAHAVLALGKFCLLDESLAKICIPVFAKQLVVNNDHIFRSNIVSVMCDLFTRFTFVMDRHTATLAACLKDRSTFIRKQTVMLLTNLIKEQYVRWEGIIMYQFVSTLLDCNEEVRQYAEMCLIDVLLPQFPGMFINHFMECMFYFNAVEHRSWAAKKNAQDDHSKGGSEYKCSLSGSKNKEKRMNLYKFMLNTFGDPNKFTLMARIGQEVFSAVVDGDLDILNPDVEALMEDCYDIMCTFEIKLAMALGQRNSNTIESELDDDDELPAAVESEAKKIVSSAFRRGIMEVVLPHILQLRYFLQERKLAKLEKGIMIVLRELCKDHTGQLDEFLACDRQLMIEIQFDLKKLEEAKTAKSLINDRRHSKQNCVENKLRKDPSSATADNKKSSVCSRPELELLAEKANQSDEQVVGTSKPAVVCASGTDSEQRTDDPFSSKNVEKRDNDREEIIEKDDVNKDLLVSVRDLNSPKRANALRAVSTPQRQVSDITFRLADISAIAKQSPQKRARSQAKGIKVEVIDEHDE